MCNILRFATRSFREEVNIVYRVGNQETRSNRPTPPHPFPEFPIIPELVRCSHVISEVPSVLTVISCGEQFLQTVIYVGTMPTPKKSETPYNHQVL